MRPGTKILLDASPFEVAYCDVSGDDEAYHRLLAELWSVGEAWLHVEQDMAPTSDQLRELADCERDWCAFPYLTPRGIIPALGCVRFSAQLLRQYPDAMTRAGEPDGDLVPPRHWWRVDVRLERVLLGLGAVRHLHTPPVRHLH